MLLGREGVGRFLGGCAFRGGLSSLHSVRMGFWKDGREGVSELVG